MMRAYRQVTEFNPPVAEFLKRHAERLHATSPLRGLWVCENDGVPEVALLVYTEPHVLVSIIVDKPETRPFVAILRLAQTFERWARDAGLPAYCVVISSADDWHSRIVERRGAVKIGEGPGWAEYRQPLNEKAPADGIEPWRAVHWKPLRRLVMAFLVEHYNDGGDFKPTRKNVELLIRRGMQAATKGDPVLIAYEAGEPIAFGMYLGIETPLELRERILHGLGTYVIPKARRAGWGKRLRTVGFEMGARAGYTRSDGIALSDIGLASGKASGCIPVGVLVRKKLGA